MTVFDLMTGGDEEHHINQEPTLERKPTMRNKVAMENVKDKIEFYSDYDLRFQDIAMPEVPVTVYYEGKDGQRLGAVDTKMKLGRVLRYQHLGRDFVDEDDYPPSQEYFLYADNQVLLRKRSNPYHTILCLDRLPLPLPQQVAGFPAAGPAGPDTSQSGRIQ